MIDAPGEKALGPCAEAVPVTTLHGAGASTSIENVVFAEIIRKRRGNFSVSAGRGWMERNTIAFPGL